MTKMMRLTGGALVLTLVLAAPLLAQASKGIAVTAPRPLWDAINALEAAAGGTVNYEDVPYENPADVQDYSTPAQRAAQPQGWQLLGPVTGTVTAEIPVPANGAVTANDLLYDVNLLLASYRQNHLPGDFQVEQANGMLYVMATKVLGANGVVRTVTSPMLTVITIPTADRSVVGTVQAIFDAVGKATGLRIGVATLPFWPSQRVAFGATAEVARDALARLFA